MTSPQRSLLPARGDDRGPFLCALELVAGGDMQFGEVVGAVVGQRIALEPGPQVFHGIEIGRVWRQIRDLDVTGQVVQVVPHQVTAVCLQPIPDDQQRLLQVRLEGVEEFDNLLFLDTALVQPKQAVGAGKTGNIET